MQRFPGLFNSYPKCWLSNLDPVFFAKHWESTEFSVALWPWEVETDAEDLGMDSFVLNSLLTTSLLNWPFKGGETDAMDNGMNSFSFSTTFLPLD